MGLGTVHDEVVAADLSYGSLVRSRPYDCLVLGFPYIIGALAMEGKRLGVSIDVDTVYAVPENVAALEWSVDYCSGG